MDNIVRVRCPTRVTWVGDDSRRHFLLARNLADNWNPRLARARTVLLHWLLSLAVAGNAIRLNMAWSDGHF
jgi:hypothetical protein